MSSAGLVVRLPMSANPSLSEEEAKRDVSVIAAATVWPRFNGVKDVTVTRDADARTQKKEDDDRILIVSPSWCRCMVLW
eukprot:scaffold3953_cov169-Amphora_coffeaeformis.AAC.20